MSPLNTVKPSSDQPYDIDELKAKKNRLILKNRQLQAALDRMAGQSVAIRDENRDLAADIDRCEKRSIQCSFQIDNLEAQNNDLTTQVNRSRQKLKSIKSDEESSLLLIGTLLEEFEDLTNEKNDLSKRIKTLQQVIEELNAERKQKLPRLKHYDAMLKDAWYELQETESKMDVSLKLSQRKSSYKPLCQ